MRVCKWNKAASDWEDAIKNDYLVVLKSNTLGKNIERVIICSEPEQMLSFTAMNQVESDEPYGIKNSVGFEGNAVDQDGDECEVVVILEKSLKECSFLSLIKG